jgi:MFS family permease
LPIPHDLSLLSPEEQKKWEAVMSTIRKWAVIAVAVICTAVIIGIVLPGITLWSPHWSAAFGVSTGSVMAATTFNQIGSALIAPFAGYAVGRIQVRHLMLIGVGITALALGCIAFATAMWQVTLLHTIALSAGVVLCGPMITQVLAVQLFKDNRGLAIGVVTSGASFSTFTMPPLIGMLLETYDWRTVELIMAGIVLALAPLIYFVVSETPAAVTDDDAPEIPPEATLSAGNILSSSAFIGILFALIPLYVVFNAIYYTLGFYLADLGAGPGETAMVVSLMGFISLFAVVAFGGLADRIPHLTLLVIVTVILIGTYITFALAQSYWVILFVLPVMGFMLGGLLSLAPAMFATYYGIANFARVAGLSQPFFTISAFSPLVAGLMRDELGDYSSVFLLLICVLPVSFIGLAILRMPRKAVMPVAPRAV